MNLSKPCSHQLMRLAYSAALAIGLSTSSVVVQGQGKIAQGPSPEATANYQQAFSYIAAAKSARDKGAKEEALNNALNEFSQAIKKAPSFADAYSNRAVAYMQLGKLNKAEEDLKKALQLDSKSAVAHYNLASLHSINKKIDLALDEIDAALANGFTRYDDLRNDPDLTNVRKSPEFRKVLEKHKVFILK